MPHHDGVERTGIMIRGAMSVGLLLWEEGPRQGSEVESVLGLTTAKTPEYWHARRDGDEC